MPNPIWISLSKTPAKHEGSFSNDNLSTANILYVFISFRNRFGFVLTHKARKPRNDRSSEYEKKRVKENRNKKNGENDIECNTYAMGQTPSTDLWLHIWCVYISYLHIDWK